MLGLVPIFSITLVIALFSDLFSRKDSLNNSYVYKEKFLWVIITIVMCMFAGLRIRYNDTSHYLEEYEIFVNSKFDYSDVNLKFGNNPGFNILNITLKSLNVSAQGFLMLYSVITYSTYVWFIRKYSTDFFMSMFIFMCMVFTFPMTAIKQTIAIAFCLIAVDRAINKKWFWFAFFILVAELFHAYSFIYLIIPFLFFIPWQNSKTWYWVLFFLIIGILLKPLMGTILNVTDTMGKEYTAESLTEGGVNPFRLLASLMPLILSYILKSKLNDPKYKVTQVDGFCMNLSFLNGEIMFVALFGTANYFARLANYFYIFPIIVLPRLFNMVSSKWRFPLKLAALLCYLFFFWYEHTHSGFMPFDQEFRKISLSEFHFFN